jgi:hypothetical protein
LSRLAIALGLLAATAPARAEDRAWLRSLPGDGRSGCCYGLAADPRGGAWFLGDLPGTDSADVDGELRTGFGESDALLLHVTAQGRIDRSRVIGGPGRDHAVELAVGADGSVYAVARFEASARVDEALVTVSGAPESALLRFDESGRCRWAGELPGTGEDGPRAMAASPTGGVAVAGTFVRAWSRGDVPEVYVATYREDGTRGWQRRCEGTGRSLAVAVDEAGRVYLGTASAAADPGGGRMAEDGWPLVQCIDARGGLQWTWEPEREPADGEPWGRVVAMVAAPEGGCIALGEVRGLAAGSRDLFLARLDAAGEPRWITRFGGPGDDAAFDLARGTDGAVLVTGRFQAAAFVEPWTVTSSAPSAGLLAEWDDSGSCAWAQVLEGAGADPQEVLPFEVAGAPDGTTWIAGWYRDELRTGGLTVSGARDDVFLGRLPPGGRTR